MLDVVWQILAKDAIGGEGGIRTPEASHPACRISSAVQSTTLPPLQVRAGKYRMIHRRQNVSGIASRDRGLPPCSARGPGRSGQRGSGVVREGYYRHMARPASGVCKSYASDQPET